VGAGFSALTGFTGMSLAVRGNVRVAAAAQATGRQLSVYRGLDVSIVEIRIGPGPKIEEGAPPGSLPHCVLGHVGEVHGSREVHKAAEEDDQHHRRDGKFDKRLSGRCSTAGLVH